MKTKTTLLTLATVAGLSATALGVAVAHPRGGHGRGPSLEKLDTDGDGSVSKVEMLAGANERFAKLVSKLDADGDGTVTVEEREALHAERAAKMEERGHGRKHHRKGFAMPDGPVTVADMQSEHEDRVSARFDKMDADGDGLLSAEELSARRGRRGGHHGKKPCAEGAAASEAPATE